MDNWMGFAAFTQILKRCHRLRRQCERRSVSPYAYRKAVEKIIEAAITESIKESTITAIVDGFINSLHQERIIQ